jgi:hypothetical protein
VLDHPVAPGLSQGDEAGNDVEVKQVATTGPNIDQAGGIAPRKFEWLSN